jgi:class 3 adenylate cyclase
MGTFITTDDCYLRIQDSGRTVKIFKKELFDNFNESVLGLGEIKSKSRPINALSVIFDLEGFTKFCKQIDPQLAVPGFLSAFLKWIFNDIKSTLIHKTYETGYKVYAELPFLSKFLGDGILFLWETDKMTDVRIHNVIVSMYDICQHYTKNFLPTISKKIVSPPTRLRCGVAMGIVYSVGDGNDFIGPCINVSARLQKFYNLSFCFSIRGIDYEGIDPSYLNEILIKKVNIRGIGEDELIGILKEEFEQLSPTEQEFFKEP